MASETELRLISPIESVGPQRLLQPKISPLAEGFSSELGHAIQGLESRRPDPAVAPVEAMPGVGEVGEGFGGQIKQAVRALDDLQLAADRQADAVALGSGNLHETAIAFEKADVAIRLASRIRNKIVEAYNEIMRMSV